MLHNHDAKNIITNILHTNTSSHLILPLIEHIHHHTQVLSEGLCVYDHEVPGREDELVVHCHVLGQTVLELDLKRELMSSVKQQTKLSTK